MSESNQRYICELCGYVYYPEQGDEENFIHEGTPFEQLPDDWRCPWCQAAKDKFRPMSDDE